MTSQSGIFGGAVVYDSARNEFVNSKHQRIAEIITDYDPCLSLMYIPPKDRLPTDEFTYVVAYTAPGRQPEAVMWLNEDEIDERLLARLWLNDSRRNDPLEYLARLEDAKEALRLKEDIERREEAMDRAAFMIRSPLHVLRMGNGRKVYT